MDAVWASPTMSGTAYKVSACKVTLLLADIGMSLMILALQAQSGTVHSVAPAADIAWTPPSSMACWGLPVPSAREFCNSEAKAAWGSKESVGHVRGGCSE